ncbi:hypothetical protein [Thioclava sp. GXIMD4216]|uniref:hypothetical protein n=1 Tax=Thioclava sp. GXIMD4216 TaxID=3131929 RepID=UPI0030D4FA8E
MKPQFALNFSAENVSLLERHQYGWSEHGQVSIGDAETLESEMSKLRAKAVQLGGQGFTTKLAIPATQILYTAVHAPGPTIAERRRQIEAALIDMTPYPVSDLVFDWSGPGKTVHVAVIARDTLREAEDFAETHGMRPVSFVAIPKGEEFVGEPWFGMTTFAPDYLAQGEHVQPDTDAMVICTPEDGAAAFAAAAARAAQNDQLMAEQAAREAEEAAYTPADIPPSQDPAPQPTEPEQPEPELPTPDLPEPDLPAPELPPAEDLPAPDYPPQELPQPAPPQPELPVPPAEPESPAPSEFTTPAAPQWQDAPEDSPPPPSLAEELAEYGQEPVDEPWQDRQWDDSDFGTESGPYAEDEDGFAQTPSMSAPAAPQNQWHHNGSDRISIPESDLDRLRAEFGVDRPEELPGSEAPLSAHMSEGTAAGAGPTRKLSGARRDMPVSGQAAGPALYAERETAEPRHSAADLVAQSEHRDSRAAGRKDKPARKEGALRKPVADPAFDTPAVSRRPLAEDSPPLSGARDGRDRISITARVGTTPPSAEDETDAPTRDLGDTIGGKPRYLGLILTGALILVLAIIAMLMGGEDTTDPAQTDVSATEQQALSPTALAQAGSEQTSTAENTPAQGVPAVQPQTAPTGTGQEAAAQALTGHVDTLSTPPKRDPEPTAPAAPPPYNQLARVQADGTVTPTPEGVLMPGKFMLVAGKPDRLPRARPEDVKFAYSEATGKPMPYQAPALKGKTPKARPAAVEKAAQAAQDKPAPAAAPEATAAPVADTKTAPPTPTTPDAKPLAKPEQAKEQTKAEASQDAKAAEEAPVEQARAVVNDPRLSSASPLRARPAAVADAAKAEADRRAAEEKAAQDAQAAMASATDQAVTVSRRPMGRPQNFSNAVQSALAAAMANRPAEAAPAPKASAAPKAAPKPAPVQTARSAPTAPEADDEPEAKAAPNMPTAASVAKAATDDNAIRLNQVNLIGVYGSQSNRRALLRMPNGRFVKVQIGDRFDDGQVTAINDKSLTYQKGSKAYRINLIDG